MTPKNLNKVRWKEAKSLRLTLGHCPAAQEKIMESIFGIATENEEDALFMAEMIQQEEIKEFVLWGISLVKANKIFETAATQEGLLPVMRDNLSFMIPWMLQSEVLVGYGYVLPRSLEDLPVPIPEDVWFGNIDWENSTVTGGGLNFASVHISPPPESGKPSIYEMVDITASAVGRPTKKQLILDAFNQGVQDGLIDFTESNATIYQKLREIIKTLFSDDYQNGKGLQDGAMQKHLAKLIDSNREK